MTVHNFVSFAGVFLIAGFAWLCSANRRVVNFRAVLGGIGLSLVLGLFIFVVPAGTRVFLFVNDAVLRVLASATAGTRFIFGRLALPPGAVNEAGETSLGSILAFQALPTIIFFAALLGALYYLGVMPFLVRLFARVFSRLLRISGAEAESLSQPRSRIAGACGAGTLSHTRSRSLALSGPCRSRAISSSASNRRSSSNPTSRA